MEQCLGVPGLAQPRVAVAPGRGRRPADGPCASPLPLLARTAQAQARSALPPYLHRPTPPRPSAPHLSTAWGRSACPWIGGPWGRRKLRCGRGVLPPGTQGTAGARPSPSAVAPAVLGQQPPGTREGGHSQDTAWIQPWPRPPQQAPLQTRKG